MMGPKMTSFRPLGDVKVKKLGRQLLINIPRDVATCLGLEPGPMNIVSMTNDELILKRGRGPAKIVDVGRGKLRLYIGEDTAPFSEGERVLVTAEDDKLVIKHIDYYLAKPSIKQGYYRVNIPWELVEKTGLDKHSLVKVYSDGRKVVIEPLEEKP